MKSENCISIDYFSSSLSVCFTIKLTSDLIWSFMGHMAGHNHKEILSKTLQRNLILYLKAPLFVFLPNKALQSMFQLWKMDLSLILSQDYIFCLEPGMVTMNKKKKRLGQLVRSYPAVKKKKKRRRKKQALNQEFSAVSVTIPFKTIVWNHHDHRVEVLWAFFPDASGFTTRLKTRGLNLLWHCSTELLQYRPHNSCLHSHFQFCSTRNQFWKVYVIFYQFHPSCNSRM